jgi:hypothetical protein
MFNDERERMLFEEHEASIQAWGTRLQEGARRPQLTIPERLLLLVGKALIRFGASLRDRYGERPRGHAYS